jgi:hypothetical protein
MNMDKMVFDQEAKRRKDYEKTVEKEKKYANAVGDTFAFESIKEGIQKARTKINTEEIMRADAEKINEIKDKIKESLITGDEKEELEQRESGELFLEPYQDKTADIAIVVPDERFGVKEAYYPAYKIEGVKDGKKILLLKRINPVFTDEQLAKESSTREPFYMKDWKGPTESSYAGQFDDQEISAEEAEKLFEKYLPFAKMRSEEVKGLKSEKETDKYGHEIKRGNWAWKAGIKDKEV